MRKLHESTSFLLNQFLFLSQYMQVEVVTEPAEFDPWWGSEEPPTKKGEGESDNIVPDFIHVFSNLA